jgi:hypothetical protein
MIGDGKGMSPLFHVSVPLMLVQPAMLTTANAVASVHWIRMRLVNGFFIFVFRPFFSPAELLCGVAGPEGAKNLAGESPPPDSNPFGDADFEKSSLACRERKSRPRIAASSSRKAVTFSSAHTMKRFRRGDAAGNVIETHEHAGDFKEP